MTPIEKLTAGGLPIESLPIEILPIEILVVEDEPLVRLTLVGILHDAGFLVLEASDAGQALAILESCPEVSLLLADINLPGQVDGIALADEVHRSWPEIPVLFTSGQTEGEARVRIAGRPFLPKPYRVQDVVRTVNTLTAVPA